MEQEDSAARRARRRLVIAEAYAQHQRARQGLLAAEEIYAQARLAFERARAAHLALLATAGFQFTCGHEGAGTIAEDASKLLILCPACRRQERRGKLVFSRLRCHLLTESPTESP